MGRKIEDFQIRNRTQPSAHSGLDLDVGAELHLGIGKLNEAMARLSRDLMEYKLREQYASMAASGTTSTSVAVAVPLGAVPAGRVYDLRLVTFTPEPAYSSGVINKITVDVSIHAGGGYPPTLSATNTGAGILADTMLDSRVGGTIPITWGPEGGGNLPIRGGDWVFVVVGKTSGNTANFVVRAQFGDLPDLGR